MDEIEQALGSIWVDMAVQRALSVPEIEGMLAQHGNIARILPDEAVTSILPTTTGQRVLLMTIPHAPWRAMDGTPTERPETEVAFIF